MGRSMRLPGRRGQRSVRRGWQPDSISDPAQNILSEPPLGLDPGNKWDRPAPRAHRASPCPGAVTAGCAPPRPPTAHAVCNESDIHSWLCAESGEVVANGTEKYSFFLPERALKCQLHEMRAACPAERLWHMPHRSAPRQPADPGPVNKVQTRSFVEQMSLARVTAKSTLEPPHTPPVSVWRSWLDSGRFSDSKST